QKAADYDAQAQYFDGLGRAAEALWTQNQDSRFLEDALRAYAHATELDAKMFNPLLGQGRLLVARNDFAKALDPLNNARAIKAEDPDVAYYLGVALHGVNRDKEAEAWLVKANQLQPRAETYRLLGEIYGYSDRGPASVAAFSRATDLAVAQE